MKTERKMESGNLIELVEKARKELKKEKASCELARNWFIASFLSANDVVPVVRCKDCKHWFHMEDGFGDCTNGRFRLDGHADPTMNADDYCSCGERRTSEIQKSQSLRHY